MDFNKNNNGAGTPYDRTNLFGGSHLSSGGMTGHHLTTEIGGLKQGGQVGIHTPFDNNGNVGTSVPFFRGPK